MAASSFSIPTVFAIDPGAIITIVVILISIIGWLINFLNEKAREQQPRRMNPRPGQAGAGPRRGEDRFQAEIDQFLQQVGGRRKPNRQRPQAEPIEIEVVPEYELAERERRQRRQRKLSSIEDRHVESGTLGAGLRTHVAADMRNTIDERVRRDITDSVEDDLGLPTGRSESAGTQPAAPQINPGEIVAMLRDRDGVRKAIIVNEILRRRVPRR